MSRGPGLAYPPHWNLRDRVAGAFRAAAVLLLVAVAATLGAVVDTGAQDSGPPVLTSATIDGMALTLVYDQQLDENVTPPTNAYVVRINGGRAGVQSVSVTGNSVELTVAKAAVEGDDVKVTYRHRARPTLRSAAGVDATTVRNFQVEVGAPAPVVQVYEAPGPQVANSELGASGQAAADFVPQNFSVRFRGGTRFNFTWTAPPSGSGAVKNYQVLHDFDADLSDGTETLYSAGTLGSSVFNESAGTEVYAQVRAQDSDDSWGPYTHVLKVTANTEANRQVPDAPAAPTVTEGNGQLTVTWTAPADNGYSITRYWVRYQEQGSGSWLENRNAWKIATGGALSYTISGLANGRGYNVQVLAESLAGRDEDNNWSASGTGTPVAPLPVATIAAGTSPVTEGNDVTFTVTLDPAPSANVDVSYDTGLDGAFGVSARNPSTVTIDASGTGTITYSTDNDSEDEAHGHVRVTLRSSAGYTVGTANAATVNVLDNDDPSATITAGSAVTEGGNASFTVTLSRAQSAAVTVTYNVTETGDFGVTAATGRTVDVNAGSSTANISVPTTGDLVDEANGSVTVTLVAGTGYVVGSGNAGTVDVNDDDTAGVTVSAASVDLTEGGSAGSYTLVLDTQPTGNVVIDIVSDDTAAATVNPSSVTFTTGNWNTAQTVTVTPVDDDDFTDETVTITHRINTASTADSIYDGVTGIADVTANVDDDEDPPLAGTRTDLDLDNDGLIEVTTLAQLDAIRHDLDGNGWVDGDSAAYTRAFGVTSGTGCPISGCDGFELTADLDFGAVSVASDGTVSRGSFDAAFWDDGKGWLPIAGEENIGGNSGFRAIFEGNGHKISNLFINRVYADGYNSATSTWESLYKGYRIGLFGATGDDAVFRNLTLEDVNITGSEEVGGLAGVVAGTVNNVTVTGTVAGDTIDVGGVVGTLIRGNILNSGFNGTVGGRASHIGGLVGSTTGGAVRYSYAKGAVNGSSGWVGGLAGSNSGTIAASYAANSVTASAALFVGGLVGQNGGQYLRGHGTIIASYSNGDVRGRGEVGGLVGINYGTIRYTWSTGAVLRDGVGVNSGAVGALIGRNEWRNHDRRYGIAENSYWNSGATSWTNGVGQPDTGDGVNTLPGNTEAQLKSPTGYTGIYANWNINVDGDGVGIIDNPWDFGTGSDFPKLQKRDGTDLPGQ